METVFSVRIYI